jgi:hypothetical protein
MRESWTKKKVVIGPFFIVFSMVALWNIFSYPLYLLQPSYLYDFVLASLPADGSVEIIAYVSTVLTYLFLVCTYYYGPANKYTYLFQVKNTSYLTHHSLVKRWLFVAVLILLGCAIAYVQADYAFPLLEAGDLSRHDYNVFRKELDLTVDATLLNFILYILLPYQILLAFVVARKNRILLSVCTVLLLFLTSMFLLSRSTLTIPILIALMSYLAYRSASIRAVLIPSVLVFILGASMMAYSTKEFETLSEELTTRIFHGQWVGLPLYFWYFQDTPASVTSSLHPYIRDYFATHNIETPGRELMRYLLPLAAEKGGAGNVPTYFVGEAYAFGGWTLVVLSTVYLSMLTLIFTWSFSRIKKSVFSCTIYGLICFKISSGLSSGVSAFFVSGTTGLIVLCFIWGLLSRNNLAKSDTQVDSSRTPDSIYRMKNLQLSGRH